MEKLAHYANFSFEYDLFNSITPQERMRINSELDYLFHLWGEESLLAVHELLPKDYISKIEALGFPKIHQTLFNEHSEYKNWVGSLGDIELERKLNSKITSFDLRNKLYPQPFDQFTFSTSEEFYNRSQKEKTYIIKKPYEMSGRGFRVVKPGMKLDLKSNGETFIAEEFVEILENISYIRAGKETYIIRHQNTKKFAYSGSYYYSNPNDVFQKIQGWKASFKEQLEKVVKAYDLIGAGDYFSIDGYIYKYENDLLFNPLGEVNHRKTMGMIGHKIHQRLASHKDILILFQPQKLIPENKHLLLSPPNRHFGLFLCENHNS